ncbi:MAG TPA: hypothetical protein VHC97_25215 [Thermoanaerobaculia bacterium]|jgi:hypothetical protein|nr:hypothetical protein [Thermoanaerobaculia bacterium]
MSLRCHRAAAALCLGTALLLLSPVPSHAAGFGPGSITVAARVWSWLESLGIVHPAVSPRKPATRWEKEGSAIDPDGRTVPGTTPTAPPNSATSDQGSAIDPDGRN